MPCLAQVLGGSGFFERENFPYLGMDGFYRHITDSF